MREKRIQIKNYSQVTTKLFIRNKCLSILHIATLLKSARDFITAVNYRDLVQGQSQLIE